MNKPVPSPLQRAWLLEIGIDARMLAHLGAEPLRAEVPASAPVVRQAAAVQAGGPESIASLLKKAPDLRRSASEARSAALVSARSAASVPEAGAASGKETVPVVKVGVPTLPEGESSLQSLRSHAEQCTACGLHDLRGRLVFGEGAEESVDWLFVGEAPGEYDDSTGRPFQGRAGELLRNMLASVGLGDAGRAYFTNILKCRPMGNRSPDPAEVASCLPILQEQIRRLRPGVLVALGRVSAGALLGSEEELDALRGRVHAFVDLDGRETPLVVMHHPATLLLHGQLKLEAWRDLNLLRALKP